MFVFPVFSPIGSLLGGLAKWSIAKALSKNISDHIISNKIGEYREIARIAARKMYENYWRNLLISGTINVLIIITALLSFFVLSVNHTAVFIISFLSISLIIRSLILTIKNIVKVIPRLEDIFSLIGNIFYFRSLTEAIKESIRNQFQRIYHQKTNGFTRMIHGAFSKFGMVKSTDDIEEDIVDEFYSLIKHYILRTIVSKIVIAAVFYGFFFVFLKGCIFSYTLKMNAFQILLYPFTVSLPKIIQIIRWGMQ